MWKADARRSVGGQSKQNFSAPKANFFVISKLRWWRQSFFCVLRIADFARARETEREEEKTVLLKFCQWSQVIQAKKFPKRRVFRISSFRSTFLLVVVLAERQQQAFFCSFDFAKKRTENIWRINLRILRPRSVCFCPKQTSDDDDWWCFYILFTSASCDLIEFRRRIRSRRRRFIEIKIETVFAARGAECHQKRPALEVLSSITRPLRNGF